MSTCLNKQKKSKIKNKTQLRIRNCREGEKESYMVGCLETKICLRYVLYVCIYGYIYYVYLYVCFGCLNVCLVVFMGLPKIQKKNKNKKNRKR